MLLQEYPLSAERVLRHLDLYRLPDPTVDLDRIGLPELLGDPQAITVVEWADRLPEGIPALGPRVIPVRFRHGRSENERTIDFTKTP